MRSRALSDVREKHRMRTKQVPEQDSGPDDGAGARDVQKKQVHRLVGQWARHSLAGTDERQTEHQQVRGRRSRKPGENRRGSSATNEGKKSNTKSYKSTTVAKWGVRPL